MTTSCTGSAAGAAAQLHLQQPSDPVAPWFLIFTKPAAEEVASSNLLRQNYRVYFPRLQQRKLHRGQWVERVSALFPRYLFLQPGSLQHSLAAVRSTVGVCEAVRFGAEYALIPDQVVNGLMRRADPQSGLHALRRPLFERGAPVRVVGGAFAGLEGIFEREIADERVVILFTLLGREAPVRVPAGFVVPTRAA